MRLFVRLSPDYTILIKFVTRRELYNTPHVYHVSCEHGSMAVQYWQLPCAEPFGTYLRPGDCDIHTCGRSFSLQDDQTTRIWSMFGVGVRNDHTVCAAGFMSA